MCYRHEYKARQINFKIIFMLLKYYSQDKNTGVKKNIILPDVFAELNLNRITTKTSFPWLQVLIK